MKDDVAYSIYENNKLTLRRINYLLWPLIWCSLLLLASCFNVNLSGKIRAILALFYCMGLFSHIFQSKEAGGLFRDFEARAKDAANFFQTRELPQHPPLKDGGFIWAKPLTSYGCSEFSRPFLVGVSIGLVGKNIDFNDLYNYKVTIDGTLYIDTQLYGGFKESNLKVLKLLESKGYLVTAITNKFGDYLWIRTDKEYKAKRITRLCNIAKIKFLILIWLLCQITPLI